MNKTLSKTKKARGAGFTLIEILIVMAIIGILAALLFPAFKSARERGYQTNCISNLHQIGLAVQLYRNDEKRFPASLAVLLPSEVQLSNPASGNTELPDANFPNTEGTGYVRSGDVLLCPDDEKDDEPRSSYGDISAAPGNGPTGSVDPAYYSRAMWNFYGYSATGEAFKDPAIAVTGDKTAANQNPNSRTGTMPSTGWPIINPYLSNPTDAYGPRNPVKFSLSNRYAPPETIITHCVFHRVQTSDMNSPIESTLLPNARDIVLRLDGSTKLSVIDDYPAKNLWREQAKAQ